MSLPDESPALVPWIALFNHTSFLTQASVEFQTVITFRAVEGIQITQARAFLTTPNGAGVTGLFEFYNIRSNGHVGVVLSVTGVDTIASIMDHRYHSELFSFLVHTYPIPPGANLKALRL
ncbi:hypothetical protein CROQUDRAFT_110131 [Cronartium quercuum f. sp. fusiforme G11]|uniref:Uncharacterized protein n=1 Tax=Cronartium quercuum f. sp. fusiforme G11 TaxID=708437 RepID=A0A9P6T7J8_9BASI|nr:hypothetical protein CROQUDRAFT_110131 [Cronartium quercuum f. sp. fusiforme G11]